MYTIEEAPYVYTEYGETIAREKAGVKRTAGTIAYFGLTPLKHGSVADTWERKGYVKKRMLTDINDSI